MIAALPMYDRPEVADATDRLWAGIRDSLRRSGHAAPETLCRDDDLWRHWQAPDLVLAQCCGLPYRARLHGRVRLIATPDYGVSGCPPGYYRSLLVVRTSDPRTQVEDFGDAGLAVNDALSQSGWAAPVAHFSARGLALRPVGPTGSHAASAAAVAEGRAEIAAIDAVTWALLCRAREPSVERLRILQATIPTPGLPLIAGPEVDAEKVRRACHEGLATLDPCDRDRLMLRGLVEIPAAAYRALPLPPAAWAG